MGGTAAVPWVAAAIFALALVHTFSTKYFEALAHRRPAHAGVWHLLGEVEVVFGFWAMVLMLALMMLAGRGEAVRYLESRNFTEPMFVFAVMVVAGSRPVLLVARRIVERLSGAMPLAGAIGFAFTALAVVPLLGSLITEPAAMTLAALMLRERLYAAGLSNRLKYALLGVLFVNVSIGGTLTSFAAPPVLMVASRWDWDLAYMLTHFGWRAAIAVMVNSMLVVWLFRRELAGLPRHAPPERADMPMPLVGLHLLFLAGIVATAYPSHQDRLILREGLLVAFFLAGLVVLGGLQTWWLEPLLRGMSEHTVFLGATALTAVTDNAALTYLGAQVNGLSEEFKRALVAGAVTGGGLTVIANAPNPAGFAILRGHYSNQAIHPLGLLAAALVPTLVAAAAFRLL